jgi:predicted nucleic acid-binding protein
MSRYAIDAQTLLRIVADERTVSPEHQLVAVNSIRSDALALLLTRVRAGDIGDRDALQLHERMTELKTRLLGDRGSRGMAWTLARRHDRLSLHDAECLAVTKLQADALVTVDRQLAALADGIVPTAPYDALFTPEPSPLS